MFGPNESRNVYADEPKRRALLCDAECARNRYIWRRLGYGGWDGRRVIGYDNERGKGDHRHYGSREEPYVFSTAEQMVTDFLDDVERVRSVK